MSNILELRPGSGSDRSISDDYAKVTEIPRIPAEELSYNDFFWNCMQPNRPVILTSVADNWKCSSDWITNGRVDLDCLEAEIGNDPVPVANCSKVYFNSHEKSEIPFREYCQYWKTRKDSSEILYLKDWHLKAARPSYDYYNVPKYYASDWLNEYLIDTNKDDYRFVYIGPEGSWTPFHADVFSSFSWSTNIVGTKKWLLLPPGEEDKLKDSHNNDPFSISEELLDKHKVRYSTVIQQPSESIFVPSKWYHQVWNVTDTISVNHNWFNGCNIHVIWESLRKNHQNVVEEISDCKDMDNFNEHCQVMLKSVFGLDFNDFIDILEHVAKKRMSGEPNIMFDEYELNLCHKEYDLERITSILKDISCDASSKAVSRVESRCSKLLQLINEFEIK
ncbi:unnamed protein product [Hermetia illucens]|uniref:Jumonji domain-containing protein 4 n=1 Tax=Hermetia illucens TaxID=343691 RepID=A0A7R8YVL3_HERIL|nr:2-oxoglutarate and iron-dependent oxygenase JMJD4 homolog [Hermetia illucens]CAD7086449.1 unnamed protein product [Hermetia illucens]